ncbi:recombinase family protein [Azospirillum canadense]|uniref:recombinase family protein n=1 Tax=Azospirillum canadense TaxID=403962 RepID=UPI0022270C29|nr:recombinase family protein [Azospirillum canadense]MCW2241343.1 DNA invertase Pin-like site-specific DNA recombinase [Azospirillum canadense]
MSTVTAVVAGRDGGKLTADHLTRSAVVYVRQSTLQQVERHQESTRLQYALVERAVALGWARRQILVIDDDLGRSASSAEGRPGFQHMVAEVGLGHVGIVLGIEMSRLARSCRDWHQLLEICAIFGTLLGDTEGIYDAKNFNDRLLLGLKGTMSEAELHILKTRMLHGKQAKADRGDLHLCLPRGYVRQPDGTVIQDPDEQARAVVALLFDLFDRHRTLSGVLRYLVEHGIELPDRTGGRPGEPLAWHRPNRATLSNLFHNPIYAGAYAYGRRPTDPRRQKAGRPGTGRRVAALGDWAVLLKDRFPAYITWEHYEANLRQLEANMAQATGVSRGGTALLSGLVVCGRCGQRMTTQYKSNGHAARYVCNRAASSYAAPLCQSLVAATVDEAISALVLRALQPAALEVSLRAAEDLAAERAALHRHWAQRLERAHYEAQRAFRQYNAVEPENRLVARTLEQQWEATLVAEADVRAEYEQFLAHQPAALSAEEQAEIRRLAVDLPALWHAPTTTMADRQAVVRQILDRVVISVENNSETVTLDCRWAGGHSTRTTLARPVARLEQLSTYPALLERVAALHADGRTASAIADTLNAEGWVPPKRRGPFSAATVRGLLYRQGLKRWPNERARRAMTASPHDWTLEALARHLNIPKPTLYAWLRKGAITGHLVTGVGKSVWMIQADDVELTRLRALHAAPRVWEPGSPGSVEDDSM